MDLQAFLRETEPTEGDFGFCKGKRRLATPREELSARLKHYEAQDEGFEATEEHLDALDAIFNKHQNVFLTGGAGTGKTTFVRSVVIPELDYRNLHWSVTATTGIAGSHLDGKTINSFFGIGLGAKWAKYYPKAAEEFIPGMTVGDLVLHPSDMIDEELEQWYAYLFDEWRNGGGVKEHIKMGVIKRLKAHEVVIIDEISMCGGDTMLGFLDYMLKQLRDDDSPYGGLQVIAVGDFSQLPPVDDNDLSKPSRPDWAFLSRAWQSARVKPLELTKVFRQGEPDFINFLNNIRDGKPVDKDYAGRFVRSDMTLEETRKYTFLVPTNKQARALNVNALQHYPEPTIPLEAEFVIEPTVQKMPHWEINNQPRVKLDLEKALRLISKTTFVRVGFPVMFTVNDSAGRFVNGTRGFIREINISRRTANDPFDTDTLVIGIPSLEEGVPEELVTINRRSFSRNRDQDPTEMVAAPPEVAQRTGMAEIPIYPVIRQFPIIPATAITIHKSQGMSMDAAILQLSNSFAAGQVYVGLSRLRSSKGMVLVDRDFEAKTDPLVMNYYRAIREGGGL